MNSVRRALQTEGLDALIVSSLPNIRYLSGFSGSNALCIVTKRSAFFITDSRYERQSVEEVKGWTRYVTTRGLYEHAEHEGLLRRCRNVAFEANLLTYADYRKLKKLFPRLRLQATADFVEELALTKDETEIAAVARAAAISDRVFLELLTLIRAGMTELAVAGEIARLHRAYGAERDAFDSIVASGERSALPHARASQRTIRRGDLLTLDFGCTVDGYNSDLTRTVGIGRITPQAKEMYSAVLEAQRAAIVAARAGLWAKDLDAVARDCIAHAGFGRYFVHSLGHGLGLHVQERPHVSALSKERLLLHSIITIEPGIYIPGFGGVRIEDDVLLLRDGCRVLTEASKELLLL